MPLFVPASGAAPQPFLRTGAWYGPLVTAVPSTANAVLADTVYAHLILISRQATIDRLCCTVGTAAVGLGKLGLYTVGADGLPDALVAACNTEVDANVTAGTGLTATFAANPTLSGWYWAASLWSAATATLSTFTSNTFQGGGFSYASGGALAGAAVRGGSNANTRYTRTAAATYASGLPATFGAGTFGTGSPGAPIIEFRVA